MSKNKDDLQPQWENFFTRREFLYRLLALISGLTGITASTVVLSKLSGERQLRELPVSKQTAFLRELFSYQAFAFPEQFGVSTVEFSSTGHEGIFQRFIPASGGEPLYNYRRSKHPLESDRIYPQDYGLPDLVTLSTDLDNALLQLNQLILEFKNKGANIYTLVFLDNERLVQFIMEDPEQNRRFLAVKQAVQQKLMTYLTSVLEDNSLAAEGISQEVLQEALRTVQSAAFLEHFALENSLVALQSSPSEDTARLHYSLTFSLGITEVNISPEFSTLYIQGIPITNDQFQVVFYQGELAHIIAGFREGLSEVAGIPSF